MLKSPQLRAGIGVEDCESEAKVLDECLLAHLRDPAIDTFFQGNCLVQLEKAMAPHSSTLAWKIPWTEEPGRLQSMESHRVGHD